MVAKTREVAIGTLWELTGSRYLLEPWSSTEHRNRQDFSQLAYQGLDPAGRDEVHKPDLPKALHSSLLALCSP